MAANPCLVAQDIHVPWDGVLTFVRNGTVVDIPPGSDLEAAYGGTDNLVPISTSVAYVVAEPDQPVISPEQSRAPAGSPEGGQFTAALPPDDAPTENIPVVP